MNQSTLTNPNLPSMEVNPLFSIPSSSPAIKEEAATTTAASTAASSAATASTADTADTSAANANANVASVASTSNSNSNSATATAPPPATTTPPTTTVAASPATATAGLAALSAAQMTNLRAKERLRSKRPMYCRNAYMHYLVKCLVKSNPYISLQSIIDVLEKKHVEYKTISVSKARADERSHYITSMKDIVEKLNHLSRRSVVVDYQESIILEANPNDRIEIVTSVTAGKELLSALFICPFGFQQIHQLQKKSIFLDCCYLRGENAGVLFHASAIDPDYRPVLLAFMIAEQESVSNWRRFLEFLESSHLLTREDDVAQVIFSLCALLESNLPQLEYAFSELAAEASPWYVNGMVRRKRSVRSDSFTLRALLLRCVFSYGSEASLFLNRLMSEKSDLFEELQHLGKWNRSLFSVQLRELHSLCAGHVEHDLLEQNSLQYLMIDDLATGLYYFQCLDCEERRQLYLHFDPDDLAPHFQQVLAEYARFKGDYSVEPGAPCAVSMRIDGVQRKFLVDLEGKSCSCGLWQALRFPCLHGWLAATVRGVGWELLDEGLHSVKQALRSCPSMNVPAFPHPVLTQIAYYKKSTGRAEKSALPDVLAQAEILPISVGEMMGAEEKNLISLWRVCGTKKRSLRPNADGVVVGAADELRTEVVEVEHVANQLAVALQHVDFLPGVERQHADRVVRTRQNHVLLASVQRNRAHVVRIREHRAHVQALHVLVSPVGKHDDVAFVRQRHHVSLVAHQRDVCDAEGHVQVPFVLIDAHFLLRLRRPIDVRQKRLVSLR